MQIPPYLNIGDKIGIVSTASKIEKNAVEPAVDLLKSMGYKVQLGKYVFTQMNQFAGTDEQRTSDLQTMLDNPEIKAIVCSRGGYGTLRTLQNINWVTFKKSPKWIVGFSDVTVLHSHLNQIEISSIHGVMPNYFLKNKQPSESFNVLIDALSGKDLCYETSPSKFNINGKAVGEIIGGNLSILYSLRGTPYDLDTRGKILFIEDLSEHHYHLDRMMMNLKTGGQLAHLAALVVGSFTGMKDNDTPYGKCVEEIILDAVSGYKYPVIFDFPAGHQENNFALKFGFPATINANKQIVKINQ